MKEELRQITILVRMSDFELLERAAECQRRGRSWIARELIERGRPTLREWAGDGEAAA